jgi:hypothetical protein
MILKHSNVKKKLNNRDELFEDATIKMELRMNWSNIEKWRELLKIGTIVLSSILKYCAKFKKI